MRRCAWLHAWVLMLVVLGVGAQCNAWGGDAGRWFRGQLHAHTYWSDGRGFPEQAVAAYKQRGYDFLSITDHNRFAAGTNAWRAVRDGEKGWPPNISRSIFDDHVRECGAGAVDVKSVPGTNGPVTMVRLQTHAELRAQYEEPGQFILIPGVELTAKLGGLHLHLNYINLPTILPCIQGAPLIKQFKDIGGVGDLMRLIAGEVGQAAADTPHMLILNHPFWVYYDVVPQNLIDAPGIRFFEICNNGSAHAPCAEAPGYTPEKFWDVVNAHRLVRGQPALYGVATDDAHFYDAHRINGEAGVGDAWVMVRAAELTPSSLISAMHAGDFYATCGVGLANVTFSTTDKTLRVAVRSEPGVDYTIQFITTKRDFDQTVTTVNVPGEKKRPARTIPVYADEIGQVVKTVSGTVAEYHMGPDDLYVRARVESDVPCRITPHFHPKTQTAWTQPYH